MFDLSVLHRPTSPEEAVRLFRETEGTGLYVGGGTVVVPAASSKLDFLVDLSAAGLSGISSESGHLVLGATVTISSLARSLEAGGIASGILHTASLSVANHTVRNLATVAGNVAAWPYPTDLPVAFLALDATLAVMSDAGEREIPIEDYFLRRGDVFSKGDLITRVSIPVPKGEVGGGFEKVGRKRLDIAIANAAATVRMDGGRIADARLAVGAMGPAPRRLPECEALLKDKVPTEKLLADVGRLVETTVEPRTDHRAGADYRRKAVGAAARRALTRATGLLGAQG